MSGDDLPNADHVARYCSPRHVLDGLPLTSAFIPRARDAQLSVNWLEFFRARDLTSAVDEMRTVFGRTFELKANGRFAVLNVRNAKRAASGRSGLSIRIQHFPTDDNPAHSGIVGYSATDVRAAVALAALVSSADVYPSAG